MAGVDVGTAYLTVVPSFKNFGSKLSSQLDGGAGFAAAGKKAGQVFGENFTKDVNGKLRDSRGRFVKMGDDAAVGGSSAGKRFGLSFGKGWDAFGGKAGKSAATGFGNAFQGGIRSIIGPAVALLAGGGAVNFLKDSVGEAREAQKVGALTEQVIKTTGGAAAVTAKQVESLSTAISNKTGIDDEQIQSSANMLLTFTNVKNQVGDGNDVFNQATQTITDMSAALGQDGKTSAVQLGKALNDPVKGITALQRVGVAFTAQQKDQIKAMVASGDTIGAQKVILGELNKEFGGAAEASSTAGEKMKVAFGNVKEQLGTALLPVLDKFAGVMTNKVFPAVSGVIGILAEGAFNGDMGFEEDSGFVTFLFNVRQAVIDIFGVLKNNDANLDTSLLNPMQRFGVFLLKARDLTKVVFQQIKFGIEGIARGFQTGVSDSDGFIGFMERAGIVARQVFDYLKVAIPPIIAAAVALWPAIKEIGIQLFTASQKSGLSTFGLLKSAFEALPGILNSILPLVENLAKWMGENQALVGALVTALTAGIAAFKVITVLVRAFAVVQGILNVVMAANPIGLIVIAIAALVAGLIYAYQNSETFRDIVNGAFEAIGRVFTFVWNNVIQPVLKFFLEMIGNIMRSFGDFLIMLGNVPGFGWAKEAGEKIKGAADEVTKLSDKIQKIPDKTVYVTVSVDAELAQEGKVAGVIAGIAARAGRNASGTPYWKGGLTWVGEEGPELLNLPRGSQILSNEDSRALVASQATVFQPTVSATAAGKGEPTVMQNFNGPIVAHDYDDFQRKMADQRRLGALAGRRA